jgi:hypothetical protein
MEAFCLFKKKRARIAMTRRGIGWKVSDEDGWIGRFADRLGPKLGQHFPLPAKELPDFLAEKLRRLEQVDGKKTQAGSDADDTDLPDEPLRRSEE